MKRLIVPLAALMVAVSAMGYTIDHRSIVQQRIAEMRDQTRQIEEETAEIRAQTQRMRGNEVQGTYVLGQTGGWSSNTAVGIVTSGVNLTTISTYAVTTASTSTSMGNNVVLYNTSQSAREYERISINGVALVGYRTAEGGITVDQNCTPHTYTPEQHLDLVAGGIGGSVVKSFPVGEPVEGKMAHRHKNGAPSQFAAR